MYTFVSMYIHLFACVCIRVGRRRKRMNSEISKRNRSSIIHEYIYTYIYICIYIHICIYTCIYM